MARYDEYFINENREIVSALDTDNGFTVWNHEHAIVIGVANTEDDILNMING